MATQEARQLEDWRLFKESGDEAARGRLAEQYLPLVKYVIDRIAYRLPDFIDRDDLISEGIIGLIDALDKFDPSRMNKFETYATVRIRGSVLDSLRHMDWIPRSLRQKSKDIEAAFAEVEKKLGRAAEDKEVAEFMGITVEDLHDTMDKVSGSVVFSFEEMLQMSDDEKPLPFITRVKSDHVADPSESIVKSEVRKLLVEAVKQLSESERMVVGLYYVENLTLKQIGDILSVTESRVCQIHTKAVIRLKNKLLEKDKELHLE